jgi:hypothetical protein
MMIDSKITLEHIDQRSGTPAHRRYRVFHLVTRMLIDPMPSLG